MEVLSVFWYHLSMFWRPANSACWTGWYSRFMLRASQVVWSFSRNGKTLLHVKNFSPKRSPCVDARNLETFMCKLDNLPFRSCELIVQPCLTMSKGWDEQIVPSEGTEVVNGPD